MVASNHDTVMGSLSLSADDFECWKSHCSKRSIEVLRSFLLLAKVSRRKLRAVHPHARRCYLS